MDGPKKRLRAFLHGPSILGRLPGFFLFKGLEWSEAELFLQAHVAPRRLSGLPQFPAQNLSFVFLSFNWRVSRQGAGRPLPFASIGSEKYGWKNIFVVIEFAKPEVAGVQSTIKINNNYSNDLTISSAIERRSFFCEAGMRENV